MPIDEFGREIPPPSGGGGGGGGGGGSDRDRDRERGGGGDYGGSHPRGRHPGGPFADPPHHRDRDRGGGGGGGGERDYRDHRRGDYGDHRRDRRDHYGRDPRRRDDGGGRSRSPPPPSERRGGSRSPSPGRGGRDDRRGGEGGGGGGGGGRRGGDDVRPPRDDGGDDDDDRGPRPRSDSSPGPDRRPRSRSRTHSDDRDDDPREEGDRRRRRRGGRRRGGRGRSRRGGSGGGGDEEEPPSGPRSKAHASERYAEQPVLCQFLWKKEEEERRERERREGRKEGIPDEVMADAEGRGEEERAADEGNDDGGGDEDPSASSSSRPSRPPPAFESQDAEDAAYRDYNSKYCLNYVRTFFNHHLDDPWFRARLSPLERVRRAKRERSRADGEAFDVRREILQSLEDVTKGVIPKKDPDCGEHLGAAKCNFVASCRLGVGTKPTAPAAHHPHHHHHHHHHPPPYGYHHHSHHWRHGRDETDLQHDVLQGEDRNRIERHAKGHLHSFVRHESCVKVVDVLPSVSDERLLQAIAEHCVAGGPEGGGGSGGGGGSRSGTGGGSGAPSSSSTDLASHLAPPTAVYGDAVVVPTHDDVPSDPYHRACYAVFPSREAKDAFLEGLHRANEEADRGRRGGGRRGRRGRGDGSGGDGKNENPNDRPPLPRVLELDVDCTDVHGRREVDHDGRGGAPPVAVPPPGSGGKKKRDSTAASTSLEAKRCTVYVSTSPLAPSQPVSVLSAAVSSRKRVPRDRERAAKIARDLDAAREVKPGRRLDDLLKLLYPGEGELDGGAGGADDEDVLDVSVAYLRRVHLFPFYDGRDPADEVGDVLSHDHPAGTIHLRLRDADEMLAKAAEERGEVLPAAAGEGTGEGKGEKEGDEGPKDMLVARLDERLDRALARAASLAERGPAVLVDPDVDAAARDLESAERACRKDWIDTHGILDADGRARCSFHFCRKLFKDTTYLHKHLLKKHSDQLRAERAKCHDGPMMVAWDLDEDRPVPPVLMDCGGKVGLVPSAVRGSTNPTAADPEPAMWREERERQMREEEERRRREEEEMAAMRAAEPEEMEDRRRVEAANVGEKRKSNFVDVDDMVEEKVELSFEDVGGADLAPPPKKKAKKKKKKLL
ncbi:hypothetical protein ACHAWF_018201 [Thalassiosira exigua]